MNTFEFNWENQLSHSTGSAFITSCSMDISAFYLNKDIDVTISSLTNIMKKKSVKLFEFC